MEYFCYVSRDKVDQLFHNYFPRESDERQEIQTVENDIGTNVDAGVSVGGILNLFKGGITYGRKGAVQRERKVKIQYTEKLRKVLLVLAKEKPIPLLTNALQSGKLQLLSYHHEGAFYMKEPIDSEVKSNKIITICTEVLSHQLLLDCSLQFFSEGNEPDGTFRVRSATSRFFTDQLELQFATIFVLLGYKGKDIIGTPLFLKLEVPDGLEGFITI
jgi:hypothetical protein